MTTLESVEAELAAADEARELHREVVRHLVGQIATLTAARDRALACEQSALGLLREVVTTVPGHIDGRRGQGPGHSHEVPGIWDDDNAPHLAGKPCEWCAAWNRARRALEVKP